MRWFQGQSRGRRRLRRPVWMMRPATVRIRKRRRLGSHLRRPRARRRRGSGSRRAGRRRVRRLRARSGSGRTRARAGSAARCPSGRGCGPRSGRVGGAGPRARPGSSRVLGVGGEAGDPPAVVVGQPQLGAGVGAFAAGDDPHPGRPVLRSGPAGPGRVGIQAVSSATCAPSRGSPSPSSAARHACSGIASMASLTVSCAARTRSSTPARGR